MKTYLLFSQYSLLWNSIPQQSDAPAAALDLASILIQLLITLVGIFVGTLAALAVERHAARKRKQQRAQIVLQALSQELNDNAATLKAVYPAYRETTWGKSFYISTTSWETAIASGDLPDIIGFTLADNISAQYADLVQTRYYVNLLTQSWFAPNTVDGYDNIQDGFRQAILSTIEQILHYHDDLLVQIDQALESK